VPPLADARFVSLTTFRRSGEPVSTPVWVASDGDALLVLTPRGSGKVRRLRQDPRVELRPCGRFGAVPAGAVTVRGTAQVLDDPRPARTAVARKYPVEHRVVLGVERALELLRRRPRTARLTLRITVA
jgi:PPOX class probable F420-dependent enzyme